MTVETSSLHADTATSTIKTPSPARPADSETPPVEASTAHRRGPAESSVPGSADTSTSTGGPFVGSSDRAPGSNENGTCTVDPAATVIVSPTSVPSQLSSIVMTSADGESG